MTNSFPTSGSVLGNDAKKQFLDIISQNPEGAFGALKDTLGTSDGTGGLTRFAGALGELFKDEEGTYQNPFMNIEGSTKMIDQMSRKTREDINKIFEALSTLTGESTTDAYGRYPKELFAAYADISNQGRSDMARQPVPTQFGNLYDLTQHAASRSLSSQLPGGFAAQALDPSTVQLNPSEIKDVMGDLSARGDALGVMDYGRAQTQDFLKGARSAPARTAGFYANSGDVASLMNYGNLG